eukprot:TRINITY_DN1051_c0_g1_i1.p1 TRINITY_DN1051_c0_g1~~TRINITY_DN1051_c0_g1_i1.p1  ORF type:complete len:163 (-),score=26.10 TRINITY_DN1051_c0_g1_i1:462-950(-)
MDSSKKPINSDWDEDELGLFDRLSHLSTEKKRKILKLLEFEIAFQDGNNIHNSEKQLNHLSSELLLGILGFLDHKSLLSVFLVCKEWRNIARTPILWHRLLSLHNFQPNVFVEGTYPGNFHDSFLPLDPYILFSFMWLAQRECTRPLSFFTNYNGAKLAEFS